MIDLIQDIRNQLLLLKAVTKFVELCDQESIGSRATVFDAISPARFDLARTQHRSIVRRAIRYLHDAGKLLDVDLEQAMPESLPAPLPS